LATGMALRAARSRLGWRSFVLLSDGECDEGSTWEAALLAAHHDLSDLTAIVDANQLQGMGRTSDVVNLEPLPEKWRSFGWSVVEVDGHNLAELVAVLDTTAERRRDRRPTAVIARTIKGKGVSFMEGNVLWHYRSPAGDELRSAQRELER